MITTPSGVLNAAYRPTWLLISPHTLTTNETNIYSRAIACTIASVSRASSSAVWVFTTGMP